MALIRGTQDADVLKGTDEPDKIVGLGGNDQIDGGGGNDVILGGDGDDDIRDSLGSDTIDAGAGNDRYYSYRGGPGGVAEMVNVSMGDGDDSVSFGGTRGGVATIDLGTGDDHLFLYGAQTATTVTTGSGRDTIGFYWAYSQPVGSTLTVTDFTAGVGGDVLSMTTLLGQVLTGWKGMHNPFTNGYVRLIQDGADTLVAYDADGRRHGDQLVTLVRLANVDATTLVADNLSGFAPDGSAPPGLRVDSVDLVGGYTLYGTISGDRIHGGDGADSINGGVGGDRIWGDAGDDRLAGDAGNDQLYGGDGNDMISDNGGSNLIDCGAGDDRVYHQDVTGGTGGGGGDETILLGDGYDWVRYQNFRSGSLTLDMGTGNDELDLYTVQDGGARITTGTGSDLISVGWDTGDHFLAAVEVTDFTAGAGGDRLVLGEWLHGAAPTWDGGDPFAEGFLRLTEAEGATLVEVDRDGAGRASGFVALARLDGVAAAALTAFNFGGFDPHGAIPDAAAPRFDVHYDWTRFCLV